MTGAAFNRGKSKQDYSTPDDFIAAVEARFGPLVWDLAASESNAKAPGLFSEEDDSLCDATGWLPCDVGYGLLWLNPPFTNIAPWAQKCRREFNQGARIALLVPASVGSNWFGEHVHGHALVLPLQGPRLSFDGENGYPKDLMLCVYGLPAGFEPWRWRDG